MPFFDKELSKAFMARTRLRNKFLYNKGEENGKPYAIQRNFCVSFVRKIKKTYYEKLNEKSVIDIKLFWKTAKPFLSHKIARKNKIYLTENTELI